MAVSATFGRIEEFDGDRGSQLLSIKTLKYVAVRSIHRVRNPRSNISGDEVRMAVSATFGRIEEFDGDRGVAAVRRDAGTFSHGKWKNRCRQKAGSFCLSLDLPLTSC